MRVRKRPGLLMLKVSVTFENSNRGVVWGEVNGRNGPVGKSQ